MIKKIFYLILTMTNILLHSNDAVFKGAGDTLFPILSTNIEMKKEMLTIKMPQSYNDFMEVSVDFTFNNLSEPIDTTVGFVSPPQTYLGEGISPPDISSFTVRANGRKLGWDISRIEKSDFVSNLSSYDGSDYIYYFDISFPEGLSNVKHTYGYKGMLDAYGGQTLLYRLTTGAMWAGKIIEDFNVEVIVPDDTYLIINNKDMDIFNWEIFGVGNVYRGDNRTRFYIKNGSLKAKINNFSPQSDLDIYNPGNEYGLLHFSQIDENKPKIEKLNSYISFIESSEIKEDYLLPFLEKLNKDELRIFRNLLFARKGYIFKDLHLQNLFENYLWYVKDSQKNNDISLLNSNEKYIFNKILEYEAK